MDEFGYWCVKNKVPHQWIDDLLPILNKFLPFKVPLNILTILKPPPNLSILITICNFSLEESLRALRGTEQQELLQVDKIELNIGMDGVEISLSPKSSGLPILVRVGGTRISPITVGVYIGATVIKEVFIFLAPFKAEMLPLIENGSTIGNSHWPLRIHAVIAYSVARPFLLHVRQYNALKGGCSKCDQVSTSLGRSRVFQCTCGELRTDESFGLKSDTFHHQSENFTPFEALGVAMVTQFPIDPKHAVDIGMRKKILNLIKSKDVLGAPKSRIILDELDKEYKSYNKFVSSEFQRRPQAPIAQNCGLESVVNHLCTREW